MRTETRQKTELIVALDVDTVDAAMGVVDRLGPVVSWYKVGKQLFTRHGPAAVEALKRCGKRVFLDLKFHDIPNTVDYAVRSAAAIGSDLTNVHASGGPSMLRAAASAAREEGILLAGVTVLTSLDDEELAAVGIPARTGDHVLRLGRLCRDCGVSGVVCSALEIAPLRAACGADFLLVVPGIRPVGARHGDQKRVMTPGQASSAGADFIVVGRPIREADDPAGVAAAIQDELGAC